MPRPLKVFRTPIGFHDAYVAAPSRKAALAAWGADVDLFARGAAEQVSDTALMAAPLARPGEVIRKARGSMEEHLAALPDRPQARPARARAKAKAAPGRTRPAPRPRPSRADLAAAEQALDDADRRFQAARADLLAQEAALAKQRHALEAAHDRDRRGLERTRAERETAYRDAVSAWAAEAD